MSKRANIVQAVIFLAFIGMVFVLNLVVADRDFSEVENRYLKKFPKFTVDEFIFGDFTTDFETYSTDQFIARDSWIAIKAAVELGSGKGENNDIYYCENGTLIERFEAPTDEKITKDAGYINALAENVDIPVHLAIIPGVAEIWSEMLPNNAPNDSQLELINELYAQVNVPTIDIYSTLNAHRDEYIFYRTDHHWTSLGAYYGYTAIAQAMGFEASAVDSYDRTVVSENFLGTVYSSSGFNWVEPDIIETFVAPYDGLVIQNYSTGVAKESALYDSSFLEKKDKYSMFFGGVTPLLQIDTGNADLPKLLIVRDSYTDSLSPFLLEHFSEIHVLDLRYYSAEFSAYIEENDIDEVLICYSASNFSSDVNLYKLSK